VAKSKPIKPGLPRPAARTYLEEKIGVPLGPRALESLPIPYVLINRRALYAQEDLDAWVQTVVANAVRRVRISRRQIARDGATT
jgi:hypothetical protein